MKHRVAHENKFRPGFKSYLITYCVTSSNNSTFLNPSSFCNMNTNRSEHNRSSKNNRSALCFVTDYLLFCFPHKNGGKPPTDPTPTSLDHTVNRAILSRRCCNTWSSPHPLFFRFGLSIQLTQLFSLRGFSFWFPDPPRNGPEFCQ